MDEMSSWLGELSARAPEETLLRSGARSWRAAEVCCELDRLTQRLAGHRVLAVLADNSPAWVLADLATQDAGVVHLPLPGFFSADQLRHALTQTACELVLTDQPVRIGELGLGFSVAGSWQGLAWMARSAMPATLPPGTAKISFTSGSTGAPKGVCLGREGLLDTARAVRDRLADLPLERHLAVLPLSLSLENVAGVYAPLLRGLPIELPSLQEIGWRGMAGLDPAVLDNLVIRTQASSAILVPELLKAWTTYLRLAGRTPAASLRFVAVGGAKVASALVEEARALGLPAYQGYGLTEAGSVVTLNRPGDDGDDAGRPLGHVRIGIAEGEVRVESRAFLGYIGAPKASHAVFRSGDLGSFDAAGHLRLSGRRSNLLITSFGRNVSPEWPEAALLADPRLLQAVVVGDARAELGALLVPLPGISRAAVAEAVARANTALPDYARIGRWEIAEPFTAANGLATGNGRPIRQRIHAHYAPAIAALYATEEVRDAVP